MTCRDVNAALAQASSMADLPENVRRHVEGCRDCALLMGAIAAQCQKLRPGDEVIERVRVSVDANLAPVRPLAAGWWYGGLFTCLALLVGIFGGIYLHVYALPSNSPFKLAAIGAVVIGATAFTALVLSRQMAPGSWAAGSGVAYLVSAILIEGAFLLLLHEYGTDGFVRYGTGCLFSGLAWSLPTAVVAWLLIRRGLVFDYTGVGITVGTLAGLTGVAMLTLHCGSLELPHVAVWHGGVLLLAGCAGGLLGLLARALHRE